MYQESTSARGYSEKYNTLIINLEVYHFTLGLKG